MASGDKNMPCRHPTCWLAPGYDFNSRQKRSTHERRLHSCAAGSCLHCREQGTATSAQASDGRRLRYSSESTCAPGVTDVPLQKDQQVKMEEAQSPWAPSPPCEDEPSTIKIFAISLREDIQRLVADRDKQGNELLNNAQFFKWVVSIVGPNLPLNLALFVGNAPSEQRRREPPMYDRSRTRDGYSNLDPTGHCSLQQPVPPPRQRAPAKKLWLDGANADAVMCYYELFRYSSFSSMGNTYTLIRHFITAAMQAHNRLASEEQRMLSVFAWAKGASDPLISLLRLFGVTIGKSALNDERHALAEEGRVSLAERIDELLTSDRGRGVLILKFDNFTHVFGKRYFNSLGSYRMQEIVT